MSKSGSAIGAENVERLNQYLAALEREGGKLPERGGQPNLSAIALACGFDRQVLYKNPAAKGALESACNRLGLQGGLADPKPVIRSDRRDQRILTLEQENATLRAENVSLRAKLRRLEQVEDIMVETGRRVIP